MPKPAKLVWAFAFAFRFSSFASAANASCAWSASLVGAGLYGALFPLVVADLMAGTGRFNVALGAVVTAQGIGAALSTTIAELIAA